jgi:hypothetical protein
MIPFLAYVYRCYVDLPTLFLSTVYERQEGRMFPRPPEGYFPLGIIERQRLFEMHEHCGVITVVFVIGYKRILQVRLKS